MPQVPQRHLGGFCHEKPEHQRLRLKLVGNEFKLATVDVQRQSHVLSFPSCVLLSLQRQLTSTQAELAFCLCCPGRSATLTFPLDLQSLRFAQQ